VSPVTTVTGDSTVILFLLLLICTSSQARLMQVQEAMPELASLLLLVVGVPSLSRVFRADSPCVLCSCCGCSEVHDVEEDSGPVCSAPPRGWVQPAGSEE